MHAVPSCQDHALHRATSGRLGLWERSTGRRPPAGIRIRAVLSALCVEGSGLPVGGKAVMRVWAGQAELLVITLQAVRPPPPPPLSLCPWLCLGGAGDPAS